GLDVHRSHRRRPGRRTLGGARPAVGVAGDRRGADVPAAPAGLPVGMSAPQVEGAAAADGRMKLHWSPSSPFVRKVLIVAHELGLAERIACVRAAVGPARLNPEVMADNPLNKIPTLVDGRMVLFD